MITNVSSLARLPFVSPDVAKDGANGGATGGANGGGRSGAARETSAPADRNSSTQDARNTRNTDKNTEKRDASGLSEGQRKQLDQLKSRDTEVRTHENAHRSAGGQFAGSPSYTYQAGPDGQRYAIGGEVSIDVSPEEEPAATIAKMEQVRRAATAPAKPSPQDYKVAAEAGRLMAEAQQDLNAKTLELLQGGGEAAGQSQQAQQAQSGNSEDENRPREEAQAQAVTAASVTAAMQAYQNAASLARAATVRGGINA